MMPEQTMSPWSERRLYRVAWAAVGLMLAGSCAGILVPAGIGWDFGNFYDAGRKVLAGQFADLYDPTALIAGAPPQGPLGFFALPISAFLYAPLALLPPYLAMAAFKAQNALAYALALALLFREYRQLPADTARARAAFAATFALAALLFQPFWAVYRVGGQSTPTMFLLLVLALMAHVRGRAGLTAGLLVVAAAIKPAFAPVLVVLALLTGPVMIGWTALWVGLAAVVSLLLVGWPVHAAFLHALASEGALEAPWYYNSAPMVLVGNRKLLAEPGSGLAYASLGWLIRAAGLAAVVAMVLAARRRQWLAGARRHFDFSVAVVATLLLAAVAWEHYLSVLFVPLSFLLARWMVLGRTARALVAGAFILSVPQTMVVVDLVRARWTFDGHLELLILGLIKSAPVWLTAVLLVRQRADVFRAYEAVLAERPGETAAATSLAALPSAVGSET